MPPSLLNLSYGKARQCPMACLRRASYSAAMNHHDALPSNSPAAPAAPRYARGNLVKVPRFGPGTVLGVAGDQVTIVFADGSARTFLVDYVEPA